MKRDWKTIKEYEEIKFDFFEGIAKITINRPRYRNAFTPLTVKEMIDAMNICRDNLEIEIIILTGEGDMAFCSGGDQNVRGHGGYIGTDTVPRLNVLDLQKQMDAIPYTALRDKYMKGDGIHWQPAGGTAVAESLYQLIQENHLLD